MTESFPLREVAGPGEQPDGLLPFQREGAAALVASPALLLADDMGLGKTIQAATAIRKLVAEDADTRVLVVAPAPLLAQWRAELRRWAPDVAVSTVRGVAADRAWQWRAAANVFLVSYDTLRQDYTPNPHAPVSRDWDAVILDEAQRIKNAGTSVAATCKRLSRKRAWALTGTPLENSLDDLASILEFVRPKTRDDRVSTVVVGPALLPLHRELQLRRRKIDVLGDLPPKTSCLTTVELGRRQRETYDRVERDGVVQLHELGGTATVQNVLQLIMRLKQVCNFCPITGESAKLDLLREQLAEVRAEGERALVFSQFANPPFGALRIGEELQEFDPLVYTGRLGMPEREAVLRDFREDQRHGALILSLKAGGAGLNLQEASYVFHFDRWWNPAVEAQAEDRAHRMGQRHPVFVYPYVCAGTIEERIEEILAAKRRLFRDVIDGVSLDVRRLLSARELFGLFGLDAPPERAGAR
ncbi:MAG: DEAD/DEAH box helicase [Chloroflexi bacterium]|nr:DEAD/DEAH box helicase [Chloroflexota bacterium]